MTKPRMSDHAQQVLGKREKETLAHLASGLRHKEIAYAMKITDSTVRNHLSKARFKLECQTNAEMLVRIYGNRE